MPSRRDSKKNAPSPASPSSPTQAPPAESGARFEEQLLHVQRLVMQGELAATAVHEISNLLTIVLFNAGLLRERHKGDPALLKYVEPILHASGLIATLCGQLRNLSRPTEPQLRVIDLVETAQGTFHLLEQIIMRELVFEPQADAAVLVYADPAHIDQILVNLVLNARDATPEEGRISIRAGLGQAGTPDEGWRYFEVEDNGTGMTPAVKQQLFRMFFTTKTAGRGSGIGLATVRHLVEEMHGRLELDSQPGRGTRFRILVPAPETVLPPDFNAVSAPSARPDSLSPA